MIGSVGEKTQNQRVSERHTIRESVSHTHMIGSVGEQTHDQRVSERHTIDWMDWEPDPSTQRERVGDTERLSQSHSKTGWLGKKLETHPVHEHREKKAVKRHTNLS